MSFENFVNWTVSIDCGSTIGNYQGQIKSVDGINQRLTLKNAFHNGILIDQDGSNNVTIKAKDIIDLNLLSQPDEGLVVPGINLELRNRLFSSAEYHGYLLERRIESMGRCTSDMCLHLLGDTQRLLVKNRHQHPTIVVLACLTEVQGAYAICAGRILASRNIRIYLYIPPNSTPIQYHFIENELKLFRTTQDLPRSPVDLILNVQYCSRLQASVIGVDLPLDGGANECKYSLVPLLPLVSMSSKNVGRFYLCDLGFGQHVFQHLQIRYASPFGAKSFVALHDN
ncbi:unnamed protein product [Rotaria sordida]|uniref:Lsm14-like N-terminal domain-containing protein n=1 Tax=Rotaria sordida TaxID=392033 RepID=A0A819DQN8_9BILA|nr:unnamed protein product [Rotaria sordida]CAF3829230.1 unnamed protein product [Rotaria sordida]CAF3832335.1 unnamed protein product [Rotaria sordida]